MKKNNKKLVLLRYVPESRRYYDNNVCGKYSLFIINVVIVVVAKDSITD